MTDLTLKNLAAIRREPKELIVVTVNACGADPLVRCNHANTCDQQCGAKDPHRATDCEPCPFKTSARCISVTPVTA